MLRIICSFIIIALIVGEISWLAMGETRSSRRGAVESGQFVGVASTVARGQSLIHVPEPSYVGESPNPINEALPTNSPKVEHVTQSPEPTPIPLLVASLVRTGIVEVALPTQGSVGTGFIARNNRDGFDVVTAAHILKDRTLGAALPSIEITSYFASNEQESNLANSIEHGRVHRLVWLAAMDPENDVAILRVVSREVPEQQLTVAMPSGHAVSSEVAPFFAWQVRWNAVQKPVPESVEVLRQATAQRNDKSPTGDFLVCRPASEPGMSGGPLLDDEGRVLGMASGNSSGLAYYVKAKPIVDLLLRTEVDESK